MLKLFFFAFSLTLVSTTLAHFDYSNCASGQCIGTPKGCIDSKNCEMVVHYAKTGDKFKFDMEADYSDDGDVEGKYIAVGLSFDGHDGMGNDAVVACFVDSNGADHVDNYWNVAEPHLNSYPVEDAQGGLSETTLAIEDQKIHCSFVRDVITEIVTPVDQSEIVVFDLSSTPFYVLLAAGPIDEETNTIRRHNMETASKEAVDFSKLT